MYEKFILVIVSRGGMSLLNNGAHILCRGSEPFAETVVQLINRTGGISALAHPWALKNPDAVIRALKGAGLNALEVYRSDGKVDGMSLVPYINHFKSYLKAAYVCYLLLHTQLQDHC